MTDHELDALVSNLKSCSEYLHLPPSVQSIKNIRCMEAMDKAVTTITNIRAQLAETRAEVAFMQGCGVIELMTRNPNINSYVIEWEGRTVRAEAERDAAQAARAAQIEVDSDDQERNYLHLHNAAYDVLRWFEIARPDLIGPRATKLRDAVMGPRPCGYAAQPHDRTALDRMRRAEREKALREAADLAAHYTDKVTAEDIANSILAMVKQEGGE